MQIIVLKEMEDLKQISKDEMKYPYIIIYGKNGLMMLKESADSPFVSLGGLAERTLLSQYRYTIGGLSPDCATPECVGTYKSGELLDHSADILKTTSIELSSDSDYKNADELMYLDLYSNIKTLVMEGVSVKYLHDIGFGTRRINVLQIVDFPNLITLPKRIFDLDIISESLTISGNNSLRSIPREIGNIKEVSAMVIDGNSKLYYVPEEIANINITTSLQLSGMPNLKTIPDCFANLDNETISIVLTNNGFSDDYKTYIQNNIFPQANAAGNLQL